MKNEPGGCKTKVNKYRRARLVFCQFLLLAIKIKTKVKNEAGFCSSQIRFDEHAYYSHRMMPNSCDPLRSLN